MCDNFIWKFWVASHQHTLIDWLALTFPGWDADGILGDSPCSSSCVSCVTGFKRLCGRPELEAPGALLSTSVSTLSTSVLVLSESVSSYSGYFLGCGNASHYSYQLAGQRTYLAGLGPGV